MTDAGRVQHLVVAQSPHKQAMLDRLDEMRGAVERDETIALFVGEIQQSREFLTTKVGALSGLEALGLMHRIMHHMNRSFDEGG